MDTLVGYLKVLKPKKRRSESPNHASDSSHVSSDVLARLYHEKQVKELCALHALNNIFQEKFFTKAILDDLCVQLSPQEFINPHRSFLGRGNYNINVIMKAVQLKNHEVIWFDKRRPISILNLDNVKGFILNVPSDYKIGGFISLPWEKKHWIAIAKLDDQYFNLDSKIDRAEYIGDNEQLRIYLDNLLKAKDKELFVIVSKEVELDQTWKNLH